MNKIKTIFTIKDLENLSGVKAHTIRIWEKRYAIFSPDRNDNNIRSYDSEDLLKLLNISFLNNFGYKISKISSLSELEREELVRQIYSEKTSSTIAVTSFKYAMFNFDTNLFHEAYNKLAETKSFEQIFYEAFVPLLEEIGLLWQTNTLKPIHEHFISSLIRQKLYSVIEEEQQKVVYTRDKAFVLFLPMHEIHELGLVFVNYLLLQKGYKTLYLGESVPMEDLEDMNTFFKEITFVSYFTVKPEQEDLPAYFDKFNETILKDSPNTFHVLGRQIQNVESKFEAIKLHTSIESMMSTLLSTEISENVKIYNE